MSAVLLQLLGMMVLIVLTGFFSAAEITYTGLNSTQLNRINRLYPGALALWEEKPNRILATLFLSLNGVSTAMGVMCASMASELSQELNINKSILTVVIGFIASTMLLFLGEILPKIWAQRYTVPWALAITPLMTVWCQLMSPFSRAAIAVTGIFFPNKAGRAGDSPFLDQWELRQILYHSHLPSVSQKLLDNVMDYGHQKVKDVMTPRVDVFAINSQLPMTKVIQYVVQSGWSRVPVYTSQLDQVIGLIYSKDLLMTWRSGALVVLQDLVRPILTVTPDTPLADLLRLFRTRHQHMAVVRTFGTSGSLIGVVTLQDAVEAIVGSIKEEN